MWVLVGLNDRCQAQCTDRERQAALTAGGALLAAVQTIGAKVVAGLAVEAAAVNASGPPAAVAPPIVLRSAFVNISVELRGAARLAEAPVRCPTTTGAQTTIPPFRITQLPPVVTVPALTTIAFSPT